MDGLRSGGNGRRENALLIQIALPRLGGADAVALVGKGRVHGVGVGLGIDCDGRDAHFLAGADDPHGDLAAVGNQNFGKHLALQHGEGKFGADAKPAVHRPLSLGKIERALRARDAALGLEGVSRPHGRLEAHLVETRVEGRAALLHLVLEQHAARLRENLAENDARHHGVAGEMTVEKEFVPAHMVDPVRGAVPVLGLVEQQHVAPVRQDIHEFFSVHALASFIRNKTRP